MISRCQPADFEEIRTVINDGASAYRGIIPADRWHDPYMSESELRTQIAEGVEFWCYSEEGAILGVMGIQMKDDVTLIRHAYVRTSQRKKGIGSRLLAHLSSIAHTPVLIGTWADASWAIDFYQKHGFGLVPREEKDRLLKKYWNIPHRQVETSVVLASREWQAAGSD
ncbi:MAG TPA: GNAT family N-acetyltransferase [Flavisolibacter sp.]|nr:GNAT family N-acetyltransferase [Flavisolibacter sp.]